MMRSQQNEATEGRERIVPGIEKASTSVSIGVHLIKIHILYVIARNGSPGPVWTGWMDMDDKSAVCTFARI